MAAYGRNSKNVKEVADHHPHIWGYNPVCKVTPVILHGVVSLQSSYTGLYPKITSLKSTPRAPQCRPPPAPAVSGTCFRVEGLGLRVEG